MTNTALEVLTARVKAVNTANKKANELFVTLSNIFKPLVGQPVLKADGELLAKVEKLLPKPSDDRNLTIYRTKSAYSLSWTVKACEGIGGNTSGKHTCLYHEATIYVAQLDSNAIQYVRDAQPFRCDYTAQEISDLRAKAAQAKKDYEAATSNLGPFGETDRG